jgi:hypothetical protein
MPCTPINRKLLTPERERQITDALRRLERALTQGDVKVTIGPQGAAAFTGWKDQDRAGLGDACALRALTAEGSFALRKAMATAEARSGKKWVQSTMAAGVHSHDGGQTWGRD